MPWSWLFPPAIWWIYRAKKWRDPKVSFALLWFVVFIAFLSLAATKRQLYLLPEYPAAALLLSMWLAEVGRSEGGAKSNAGRFAVRWYSWALVAAYISLGAF